MNRPLCFVLMPFGSKVDGDGRTVDFDRVYAEIIAPAVAEAGLEVLRADEEVVGGLIHKPMFERLILCDFAVADLTTANANVFYELGIRHAVRPATTVAIHAETGRLPFDVAPLRALPYRLSPAGHPLEVEPVRSRLAARLLEARRSPARDSPVFQLVEGFPDVAHARTDVFRERVEYAEDLKRRIAAAREKGLSALRMVGAELEPIAEQEAGVAIDLFLSFRGVEGWREMVALAGRLSRPLAETVLVQEQLALALNRLGEGGQAERVILGVLERWGPSSESYGILGRIYKDRWALAVDGGDPLLARGLLDRAIDAYRRGFETDWRDAYPGLNAVTLMEVRDPPSAERERLLPVVRYAVERRIAAGDPDYWDHASRLELAVLRRDADETVAALGDALATVREPWEPRTTARNLQLIRRAREARGESDPWMTPVEERLHARAEELTIVV